MVVSGEVKHAVQDKDFHFRGQIMSECVCTAGSNFQRNGDVAGHPGSLRRKRQNICGLVFPAKAAVERPHLVSRRDRDIHIAAQREGTLRLGRKTAQRLRAGGVRNWRAAGQFCPRTNGRAVKPSHNMVASFYSEMRFPEAVPARGGTSASEASRSSAGGFPTTLIRCAAIPLVVFHSSGNCSLRPL